MRSAGGFFWKKTEGRRPKKDEKQKEEIKNLKGF